MSPSPAPILPRELVAERLAIPRRWLIRYETLGWVQAVRSGDVEGYGPAEIRRLWTIVSLQRDLGVNRAGVDAVLKLRSHIDQLHGRMAILAEEIRKALEAHIGQDED